MPTIPSPVLRNRTGAFLSAALLLGCLLTAGDLIAQSAAAPQTRYWIDVGAGFGAAGGGPESSFGGGPAVRGALHYQVRRLVLTAPLTYVTGGVSDLRKSGVFGGTDNMNDQYLAWGLMGGYVTGMGARSDVVLSAGLTRVLGYIVTRPPDGEGGCTFFCNEGDAEWRESEWVTGVPLELAFYSGGRELAGVSVTAWINFNTVKSFGGLTVNLMLGSRPLIR